MKWFAAMLIVVACGGGSGGGGSGVPGGKHFVDLDASELDKLCTYMASLLDPRTIECSDGRTITIGTGDVAACVADFMNQQAAFPPCTATVDNVEGCSEGFADQSDAAWCAGTVPPACAALMTPTCGG